MQPARESRPATAEGETIEAVSRQVVVEPYRVERWRERALAALDVGLKDRAEDEPIRPG